MPVLSGICDNRPLPLEAVRSPVLALLGNVDFVDAVLQEVGQPMLQELQAILPRLDNTRALIIQDNKVNQNQKGKRPKADWRKLQ